MSANFDQWGQYFTDVGSWLRGSDVDLNAVAKRLVDAQNGSGSTPFIGPVTWSPSSYYSYTPATAVQTLRDKVAGSAGVGKVSPVPGGYSLP